MINWNLKRLLIAVTVCYNHNTTNTSIKKCEIRIQPQKNLTRMNHFLVMDDLKLYDTNRK